MFGPEEMTDKAASNHETSPSTGAAPVTPPVKMADTMLRGLFDPVCALGLLELHLASPGASPGPVLLRPALTWAQTPSNPGESFQIRASTMLTGCVRSGQLATCRVGSWFPITISSGGPTLDMDRRLGISLVASFAAM